LSDILFAEEVADSNFEIKFTSQIEEEKRNISVYDECIHYIAPNFMIHPVQYRSLSIKLSLEAFI